jgi:mannose-6-phosphate isomerase-like protein (cupin superfamily)
LTKRNWTKLNWADRHPHIGHENVLIHYIYEPKGMEGKAEGETTLFGQWRLTKHSIQPSKRGDFHTHDADTSEHVFYVLGGSGQIKLDEEIVDVGVGDAVHVPPSVGHQSINNGDEWLDMLVISASTRRAG